MRISTLKICLSIFLFALMIACSKDREVADYQGNYTLSGRVLDEITGRGIPYATIGVIERKREWFSSIAGKTVAYDKADADGNYSFTFPVNSKENNYYLTAQALTYFERTDGGDAIRFTKNGSKKQDINLIPHSFLSFWIKGNKGGKEIRLSAGSGGGGISFYQGVDTVRTYLTSPLINSQSAYWVFYNDTSLNYNKSFHLPPPPPHDTTYYLIEF